MHPLPKNDYMEAHWQHMPYRSYEIHYSVDPRNIQLASQNIGSYHTNLEFLAVVYDDSGEVVNSIVSAVSFDLNPDTYAQVMRHRIGFVHSIAIPAHGEYFLRLGVHDLLTGHIGVLEIPAESIKLLPSQSQPPVIKTQ